VGERADERLADHREQDSAFGGKKDGQASSGP
jgi:hypothetical protein